MTETASFSIWHCRALDGNGHVVWVALVQSDRYSDGAEIDLPEPEAVAQIGEHAIGYARFGEDGTVTRLEVTSDSAPKAPPMWFAEFDEPTATPPATSLIAFTGHGVEPGTLVDRASLRDIDVTSQDQLAAFRWYPASGFGDQLYVSPQWRRRTIGSGILAVGGTLAFARGWPRLWGDGQRTAEGDRMRKAGRWAHMAAELTHILPPMTPMEDRP